MGKASNRLAAAGAVVSIITTTGGVGPSVPSTATNNGLGGISLCMGNKS